MNIFVDRKTIIRLVCYLTAFAVLIAGFIFTVQMSETEETRKEAAYRALFLADGTEVFEKMAALTSRAAALTGSGARECFEDIRLYSRLSLTAFGHCSHTSVSGKQFLAFLSCLEKMSDDASFIVANGGAPEVSLWETTGRYAASIQTDALPLLVKGDKTAFETKLAEVFSGTELETLLYENGYGDFAADSDFMFTALAGAVINEDDAISLARTYLGKKARLNVMRTKENPELYVLGGNNISAAISVKGGHIIQLMFDTPKKSTSVSESDARKTADNLISELGFIGLTNLSSKAVDGSFVFEFAPVINNVICLDEKITVGVTCDTGRLCLFDALPYYRYHKNALVIPENVKSADEISQAYALTEVPVLCKIERTVGIETLCYRFGSTENPIFADAISGKLIMD